LFAVGQPSVDGVCPRRRGRCVRFAFLGSVFIRVPRLAQQGDDLALAILPCVVEGRLAPLVLERRIRTSFEETLGDREAAVGYRVMQS